MTVHVLKTAGIEEKSSRPKQTYHTKLLPGFELRSLACLLWPINGTMLKRWRPVNETKYGVNGACGRMGQRIIQLAQDDTTLQLVAATDVAAHPAQGTTSARLRDLANCTSPSRPPFRLTCIQMVMIDFSLPEGTMHAVKTCVERRIPLVVATTGHLTPSAATLKELLITLLSCSPLT
jgi:hypothetical protein